jgi:hypothetical protein
MDDDAEPFGVGRQVCLDGVFDSDNLFLVGSPERKENAPFAGLDQIWKLGPPPDSPADRGSLEAAGRTPTGLLRAQFVRPATSIVIAN